MIKSETNTKTILWFLLALLNSVMAIVAIGFAPFVLQGIEVSHIIISLIFAGFAGSLFWIKGIKQKQNLIWLFVFFIVLNYILLITGKVVFEWILNIRLDAYTVFDSDKVYSLVEQEIYIKLLNIYTNDLSRNILYFMGFIYSLLAAVVQFGCIQIIKGIKHLTSKKGKTKSF